MSWDYGLAKIESAILLLRGQKVMLDRDLAAMYGVETRVLNQAVRRNIRRFPSDFMFELTRQEVMRISQIVTSSPGILSGATLGLHVRSRRFVRGEGPRTCRGRRKASAVPGDPRLGRGYPIERGGPPPLLGLSPGLCGWIWAVAQVSDRIGSLVEPNV